MKKLLLIILFVVGGLIPYSSKAQVAFNITIGNPPWWAPHEYAHHTRYYYIPEIDSYYDASRRGYFINDGNQWEFTVNLPTFYGNVDFASCHRIAVNYYGDEPYTYYNRNRYAYVRSYHPDWGDSGYYRGHDNGKHKGWYKYHGDDEGYYQERGDKGGDRGDWKENKHDRDRGDKGDNGNGNGHGHGHGDD